MSLSEIIQIIIAVLSLFTTIIVSFTIYWLQRKHENEIRRMEENQKRKEFEEKAEKFLFDNEDERDYLANCIIAANLHRHENHTRKIYKNFCQCSLDLQNEILRQAGFDIQMIETTDWVDMCFKKLQEDIEEYELGRNILYEGAKYFHYNFEYYRDNSFDIGCVEIIEPLYPSPISPSRQVDIGLYINQYLDYVSENRPAPDKQKIIYKPIDYIWENYNSNDELLLCKWVMVLVKNIVTNIYYKFRKNNTTDKWEQYWGINSSTIEDAYYNIMFRLYAVYYIPTLKNNTPKQKQKKFIKKKNI